jgi:hypothetical protein
VIDPDRPPFLGTWTRVYAALLAWLGFMILALYVFAEIYRP